jgi:hypothetical protein
LLLPTGIPINQQHLLYNHKELSDTTTLKDIPLVNGSRLKLVLGMRGGPVSARRVVSLQDYDNLFDISDVFQSRYDQFKIAFFHLCLQFFFFFHFSDKIPLALNLLV